MKLLLTSIVLAGAVCAQDTSPFVTLPDVAAGPIVTAVVSGQGTDVIRRTTGYSPANSSLARVDICNADALNDHNQSVSGALAAIALQEQYSVYGSEVVNAVLAQLQSRDIFTRAQKALGAASNTAVLLTALFKTLNPTTAAIVSAAPAIAQAILPAVGDPRDLAALGQKILQDNTALTLGKRGSGNDCHTGLIVVMTGAVKIAKVTVQ
ncbi:MAG TPA: hypothetical protein VG273_01425 [Bryobacteraceae bacterium]|jgi:hypothetical protein|nr:hypothetical protein [Bryobacteraceae bacterium]